MDVSELSDVIHDWEVLDSYKNFGEDVLIGLIPVDGHSVGDFVEFGQNEFWFQADPICYDWQGLF
jgi:hypothetical protein